MLTQCREGVTQQWLASRVAVAGDHAGIHTALKRARTRKAQQPLLSGHSPVALLVVPTPHLHLLQPPPGGDCCRCCLPAQPPVLNVWHVCILQHQAGDVAESPVRRQARQAQNHLTLCNDTQVARPAHLCIDVQVGVGHGGLQGERALWAHTQHSKSVQMAAVMWVVCCV